MFQNYEEFYNRVIRKVYVPFLARLITYVLLIVINLVILLKYSRYKLKDENQKIQDFNYDNNFNKLKACRPYGSSEKVLKLQPMDSTDLSIIIPCYNAADYIEECINALLSQKSKYTFNAIFINDGSTDNTIQILDRYSDNEKIIVIDNEKRGIGYSRNRGLERSTGRYVMFADADDILLPGIIETMLNKTNNGEYDLVGANYQFLMNDDRIIPSRYMDNKEFGIDLTKNREFIIRVDGVPWMKLYRRSLWEGLFLSEQANFEDSITRLTIFRRAKNYYHTNVVGYSYRKHYQSISFQRKKGMVGLGALYVINDIMLQNERIGLANDSAYYKLILLQLSKFLYPRVLQMDKDIQENILAVAKGLLLKLEKDKPDLSFKYTLIYNIIMNEDIENWAKISRWI